MNKIVLLIIILVILIAALAGIYYFIFLNPQNMPESLAPQQNNAQSQLEKKPTVEEQAIQIKKDYPLVVRGIISFLDNKGSFKTTVKSDDGKIYTLWPAEPSSVYGTFKVKSGGRVEIQGRVNNQGNLEWGSMKSI
jgi:hypothetical protein